MHFDLCYYKTIMPKSGIQPPLGYNTNAEQKAVRMNITEVNRNDLHQKLYNRMQTHAKHIKNNDIRLVQDGLKHIRNSSGALSEFKMPTDSEKRPPLFMYGERMESRRCSKRIAMIRFWHQRKLNEELLKMKCRGETDDDDDEDDDDEDCGFKATGSQTTDEIFQEIMGRIDINVDNKTDSDDFVLNRSRVKLHRPQTSVQRLHQKQSTIEELSAHRRPSSSKLMIPSTDTSETTIETNQYLDGKLLYSQISKPDQSHFMQNCITYGCIVDSQGKHSYSGCQKCVINLSNVNHQDYKSVVNLPRNVSHKVDNPELNSTNSRSSRASSTTSALSQPSHSSSGSYRTIVTEQSSVAETTKVTLEGYNDNNRGAKKTSSRWRFKRSSVYAPTQASRQRMLSSCINKSVSVPKKFNV